jgi:acetylornithine deacetylase/succinyl-diaminopimelate desuccinylase-like protein
MVATAALSLELLDETIDWLRIPSVSTGGGDPHALERAAAWVVERVAGAGGEARLVETAGHPLAVGELHAGGPDAPTVLIYGHYDVQATGPLAAWTTPPFEPVVRDGRLFARGASDDKGNFLPLLHVACELARAGSLPVNVRVLVEGEEEVGSASAVEWVMADERGADCAVVFDTTMLDPATPAVTIALRGVLMVEIEVRTAERDLHSGSYGGSALNALHVLHGVLAGVLPDARGRLREELRAGVAAPTPAELASWRRRPPGGAVLAAAGARPGHAGAGAEYYERTGADTSLDVHSVRGGEPRTIVPAAASATLSQRLAPGQSAEDCRRQLDSLLRAGVPDGAELTLRTTASEPSLFAPDDPAIVRAVAALERACGVAPALVREGGSIPVVAALAARGIPVVVTGFGLADDRQHAPDESFRLSGLQYGAAAARELYAALSGLSGTGAAG